MKRWMLVAGVSSILGPGAGAGQAPDQLGSRLAQQMERFAADGFSGAVVVAVGDRVLLHDGFGYAVREVEEPVTARTMFDIGSVSKQFTKAAILKLSERGALDLDAPIPAFFQNVPADKTGITVRHLLQMESGLQEYVDLPDEPGDFTPLDRVAARDRILGQDLQFEPGTARAYSNSGYTLLSLIVESVSGLPFIAFLRSELLEPAGLVRTGFYHEQDRWQESEVARGYDALKHGEINSPYFWPEMQWALVGNGGMVSSPIELFHWIRSLKTGRVLSPPAYAALYNGHPPTGPAPAETPMVMYAGANDFGFETIVLELFDDRGVVIVSSNAATNLMTIAGSLGGILLGKELDLGRIFSGAADEDAREPGQGWGLPDSPRGRRASEFLDMIADGSETAARAFLQQSVTPVFRDMIPMADHLYVLSEAQKALADPEVMGVVVTGEHSMTMTVRGRAGGSGLRVEVELEPAEPFRIASLGIGN